MPLREVFSVDVEDDKFRSFLELVQKYRETVASMPGLWGKSNAATKEILAGVTAISGAQQEMFRQGAAASERLERSASGLHTLWGRINTRVESFAAGLERAALRLGGLTALGAGLLGVGGLWGLESYAASAGRARRTAQGLGTTVPGMMAFEAEYGRYVDPGSFMEAIAGAQTDPTQRGWLYNIGLNNNQIGQDPAQTGPLAMQRIWQLLHRLPRWEVGLAPQMFGLDRAGIGADEARRIYDTPYSDFAVSMQRFQRDQRQFNITDKDLENWQNLNRQLDVAGKTLWAVFGTSLARWAPEIDQLSQSFTGLVQEIVKSDGFRHMLFESSEGLRHFKDYLKSDEFGKDVNKFEGWIKRLDDILKDNVGGLDDTAREIDQLKTGITNVKNWFKNFPNNLNDLLPGGHSGPGFVGGMSDPSSWWHGISRWWHNLSNDPAAQPGENIPMAPIGTFGGALKYMQPNASTWSAIDLINHYESNNQNVMNYRHSEDPNYFTAGGVGQIVNSTWRRYAPLVPGASQYARAIDAPIAIQRQVEAQIFLHEGYDPWAKYDARLARAIGQVQVAQNTSPNIQQPQPVTIYLHGNTAAVSPISANSAAGGVY